MPESINWYPPPPEDQQLFPAIPLVSWDFSEPGREECDYHTAHQRTVQALGLNYIKKYRPY